MPSRDQTPETHFARSSHPQAKFKPAMPLLPAVAFPFLSPTAPPITLPSPSAAADLSNESKLYLRSLTNLLSSYLQRSKYALDASIYGSRPYSTMFRQSSSSSASASASSSSLPSLEGLPSFPLTHAGHVLSLLGLASSPSPPPSQLASAAGGPQSPHPHHHPMKLSRDAGGANSHRVEEYVSLSTYAYFLEYGVVPSQSVLLVSVSPFVVSDEEYVLGTLTFLTRLLPQYMLNRAIARDARSLRLAVSVVDASFDVFGNFDFRNGEARKRYDAVKYALRRGEDLLYEVELHDESGRDKDDGPDKDDADGKDPDGDVKAKRLKVDDGPEDDASPSCLLPVADLAALRSRFELYDKRREIVIKKSRDIQKAAKNAVYATHRGDAKQAGVLISQCEALGVDVLYLIGGFDNVPEGDARTPIRELRLDDSLRAGSFSACLEEYCEALLFYRWYADDTAPLPTLEQLLSSSPPFSSALPLSPAEYVGGLCDLTGEVVRVAVTRAGRTRSKDAVQRCLDTCLAVLVAMEGGGDDALATTTATTDAGGGEGMTAGAGAFKCWKKMEPLRQSVAKLETVLYELSALEAKGGGRKGADMDFGAAAAVASTEGGGELF